MRHLSSFTAALALISAVFVASAGPAAPSTGEPGNAEATFRVPQGPVKRESFGRVEQLRLGQGSIALTTGRWLALPWNRGVWRLTPAAAATARGLKPGDEVWVQWVQPSSDRWVVHIALAPR